MKTIHCKTELWLNKATREATGDGMHEISVGLENLNNYTKGDEDIYLDLLYSEIENQEHDLCFTFRDDFWSMWQ